MKPDATVNENLWKRAPLVRYSCWLGAGLTALGIGLSLLHPPMPLENKTAVPTLNSPSQSITQATPPPIPVLSAHPANKSTVSTPDTPAQQTAKEMSQQTPSAMLGTATKKQTTNPHPTIIQQSPHLSLGIAPTSSTLLKHAASKLRSECAETPERVPNDTFWIGTTEARLPSQGIVCLFTGTDKLYQVWMAAPYTNSVDGVHIGDSADSVKQRLGMPIRTVGQGNFMEWFYQDIGFDISNGAVSKMRIFTMSVAELQATNKLVPLKPDSNKPIPGKSKKIVRSYQGIPIQVIEIPPAPAPDKPSRPVTQPEQLDSEHIQQ